MLYALVFGLMLGATPAAAEVPAGEPLFESQALGGALPFSHAPTIAVLPDGKLICAWYGGSADQAADVAVYASERGPDAKEWSAPKVLVDTPGKADGNPVLYLDANKVVWLFFATISDSSQSDPWATCKVKAIASDNLGASWSKERIILDEPGFVTRNKPITLRDGAMLLPIYDERNWTSLVLITKDGGNTWERSQVIDSGQGPLKGNIQPALVELSDGSILCLMRDGSDSHRAWRSVSTDGGYHWTTPVRTEIPNPNSALDLVRLESGHVLAVLNPLPEGRNVLSAWLSSDDGRSWTVFRSIDDASDSAAYPSVVNGPEGKVHVVYAGARGAVNYRAFNEPWVWQDTLLGAPLKLANVVPALRGRAGDAAPKFRLPLPDVPEPEHVRSKVAGAPEAEVKAVGFDTGGRLLAATDTQILRNDAQGGWAAIELAKPSSDVWNVPAVAVAGIVNPSLDIAHDKPAVTFADGANPGRITAIALSKDALWIGADTGLYRAPAAGGEAVRHAHYGVDGPLANRVTSLAVDATGVLWVGTPQGLSMLKPDGMWSHLTGRQGMPFEDVTALALTPSGDVWIGTSRGAILYRPQAEGRRWFYRAGKRYLPGDKVNGIAVSPNGEAAYFATDAGLGRIDFVQRTLFDKAQIIEDLVNKRHRRLGLVADTYLDDAENPTSGVIGDNDNDGLWTAYHVTAMSLAYGATGDETYKRSAMEGMHALVMLQNASGTPGLVARSVLPAEEGKKRNESGNADRAKRGQPPFDQWQPATDGQLYWKSDTSSDEIDGHYMAFYAYYRHVAQFDPKERELLRKQVSDVTNYIVDHNYQLIDWTGKRTRWGFWNPENLNDNPSDYIENGLNSLQILSFLKTAHFVTGDPKFREHYKKLILEHHYMNNVLLEKKVFPDENNHSDDQLGFTAWYPILQLEQDPQIRRALMQGVRRHYLVVEPEGPSYYIFAYATIDPNRADIPAGVRNLREIPTDRRSWRADNSHRADVVFDPRVDRFGERQMVHVLPADERDFRKWNANPYIPDEGGDGRNEDDGAAYLLPYWMARYHGFLAPPSP